jgi:hypothetical protein
MQKMARQGKMARHQGIKAKMARQRWQGTQGIGNCHHRHAIIGKACHRQGKGRKDARHRHAIIGIIIGNCHRHRQVKASASQGIGMPSASASARHAIGMPLASAAAGRRTARRSTVAQYSHTDFSRVFRCAVVRIF